jgi:hypothetical protein
MFADDTNVSFAADSLEELQSVINSELERLKGEVRVQNNLG